MLLFSTVVGHLQATVQHVKIVTLCFHCNWDELSPKLKHFHVFHLRHSVIKKLTNVRRNLLSPSLGQEILLFLLILLLLLHTTTNACTAQFGRGRFQDILLFRFPTLNSSAWWGSQPKAQPANLVEDHRFSVKVYFLRRTVPF